MGIKFACDLNKLKAGDILIFAGDTDNDFFTHKAEYAVYQDEEGLYVIDDNGEGESLNEVSGQYFIVKYDVDTSALQEQHFITEKALKLACNYIREYSPGLACEPVRDVAYWMYKAKKAKY